jgi:hypothetical protein
MTVSSDSSAGMSKVPPECRETALDRVRIDRQEVSVISFRHNSVLLCTGVDFN